MEVEDAEESKKKWSAKKAQERETKREDDPRVTEGYSQKKLDDFFREMYERRRARASSKITESPRCI